MSKANGKKPPTHITTYHGRREQEYVTSLGVTVFISATPLYLMDVVRAAVREEWAERGKPLPVTPTYETKNIAGDTQRHEHDETTIETDDEKAAWAAYKAAETEFNREVSSRMFEEIARQCIRVDIPPDFAETHKRLRPPTEPAELHWFYLKVAALGGSDIKEIFTISARLTGMEGQRIEAVEDSFRSQVEKPNPAEAVAGADGGVGA